MLKGAVRGLYTLTFPKKTQRALEKAHPTILVNDERALLERIDKDLASITILDLSFNDLRDADLPFIVNLVRKLANCETVDLTHCWFKFPLKDLLDLVAIEHVRFVDLSFNEFEESVTMDTFLAGKISQEAYKKLIFLSKEDVAGDWKECMAKKFHEVIEIAHYEYYFHRSHPTSQRSSFRSPEPSVPDVPKPHFVIA